MELHEQIARIATLLKQRQATVSVCEAVTGGALGAALTVLPGASDWFKGGFITYSNEMKQRLVGVNDASFQSLGAVSAAVAKAMAIGTRERCDSTYAVGVTGHAGPEPSGDTQHVGVVFVAVVAADGRTSVNELHLTGTRDEIRQRTVTRALDHLERLIHTAPSERSKQGDQ